MLEGNARERNKDGEKKERKHQGLRPLKYRSKFSQSDFCNVIFLYRCSPVVSIVQLAPFLFPAAASIRQLLREMFNLVTCCARVSFFSFFLSLSRTEPLYVSCNCSMLRHKTKAPLAPVQDICSPVATCRRGNLFFPRPLKPCQHAGAMTRLPDGDKVVRISRENSHGSSLKKSIYVSHIKDKKERFNPKGETGKGFALLPCNLPRSR